VRPAPHPASPSTCCGIDADLIVGADGLHSNVARLVCAAPILEGRHATGVLFSYWENFRESRFYWRFRPGIAMGIIPTNGSAYCVFVAVPADRFPHEVRGNATAAYDRLLREAAPEFAPKFDRARRVERVRGFPGHRGFIRTSSGPGWALVGDASYFKDPISAHGITDALRDAEFLARAIVEGTAAALKAYESARLQLPKALFQVTDEIASLARSDAEVQSLHRAFSAEMSHEVRALAAPTPLSRMSLAVQ
jgi:2-polyprenyl-6-methoxyphenol hydroxylase-like FAD-dependent oxidoreductase